MSCLRAADDLEDDACLLGDLLDSAWPKLKRDQIDDDLFSDRHGKSIDVCPLICILFPNEGQRKLMTRLRKLLSENMILTSFRRIVERIVRLEVNHAQRQDKRLMAIF